MDIATFGFMCRLFFRLPSASLSEGAEVSVLVVDGTQLVAEVCTMCPLPGRVTGATATFVLATPRSQDAKLPPGAWVHPPASR